MAIFINNIPAVDPNVKYEGKTYPGDKVPIQDVPIDSNVQYNGNSYPRDKVKYIAQRPDPTNQPSITIIGGIQLPPDTLILVNCEKIITKDTILDGVVVFEHIARHPYEIEFDIVIREQGAINGFDTGGTVSEFNIMGAFPQQAINKIWDQVWKPDSVQKVTNTYLHGLGISEIVIESVRAATVRGSKNIPVKIRAYENIPGQSLIITNQTITIK